MLTTAIQYQPVFKNVQANLRQAAKLVIQAAEAGSRLVVLPELCTTGYSFMSEEDAAPFAEVLNEDFQGASQKVFKALVDKYNIAIAWGLVERDTGTGGLFNSQVLLLPDGRYTSFRKINPWGNDLLWATEGYGRPPILEYEGKKVGLLICRDIRNEADRFTDLYEKGDADIVCFSSNFGKGGFPSNSWVKFSKKTSSWLVVSNRYGEEVHNDFGPGGICIVEPSGKVHCDGLRWKEPCLVTYDIP